MIPVRDLRQIARARLSDAQVLFRSRRYDGGVYLCGYAVEIALKARICRTLRWPAFPSTAAEFQNYTTFRTHNLDVLLRLSGREAVVKARHLADCSVVVTWDPEARYRPTGTASRADLGLMISSTQRLLRAL